MSNVKRDVDDQGEAIVVAKFPEAILFRLFDAMHSYSRAYPLEASMDMDTIAEWEKLQWSLHDLVRRSERYSGS